LMSRLAIYLLGPPRIELDGTPVHIGRKKAVALLAYLAVTGRPHRRDTLATLLWPEFDHSGARAELRRVLSALKRALGEGWLVVDRSAVGLNPEADIGLDVAEFRHLLAERDAHSNCHPAEQACEGCCALLQKAITRYCDDFMVGFALPDSLAFDEWQRYQADMLRDELAGALTHLADYLGARGTYEEAIAHGRRWLELDPLDESAHRCLMTLYAQAGRRAAALRQYCRCARDLETELGVSPSPKTTALYSRIRAGAETKSERQAVSRPPHNLPAQPTPFVGRKEELARITRRLDDPACRLLTLVGPGGIGKTRLAIQAGLELMENWPERPRFTHGVFFIPLATFSTPDMVVPTIANCLDFSFYEGPDPTQQLLDYLCRKDLLLVLDNFEHLLEGASLVTKLLATAPRVKVLVTSREALKLHGEWFHPLQGLSYPTSEVLEAEEGTLSLGGYEAVALFVQSARRAQPDFSLSGDERSVLRICQLVEGIPLAIELAAAWLRALSAIKIAEELERGLDILTTSMRDLPARHRSMRAVFDHSWNLLTTEEREVMQALSVFRGGFQGRAAQTVAGASLMLLAGLVEKSILAITPSGRYIMHELLRQYAAEKLQTSPQESNAAHKRHCEYYAAFLHDRGEALKGERQQAALAELRTDIENARAAWNWAVEQNQARRLNHAVDGLCRFYEWQGCYQDGATACETIEDSLRSTASCEEACVMVRSLAWQSRFSFGLGHVALADQLLSKSLQYVKNSVSIGYDIHAEEAFILFQQGHQSFQSDRERAGRGFERSLALYRTLGDQWGTANALERLGEVARSLGHYERARALYRESLDIRQVLRDQRGIADSLRGLSVVAANSGHLEEAELLVRQAIATHEEIGNTIGVADGRLELAGMLTYQGRFSEAQPMWEETLAVFEDTGRSARFALAANMAGWNLINMGLYEEARDLNRNSLALSRELGDRYGVGLGLLSLGEMALTEERYADAQPFLEESVAVFRELGQKDEAGLALAGLAPAAIGLGMGDQAQTSACEALQISAETGGVPTALAAIAAVAVLLADAGDVARAVELHSLVARYPYFSNSCFREDTCSKYITRAATELPPDVLTAKQEGGRARDLWATVKELLDELCE
jgi:predicted ATPase/DNA-binding SARP family transcriptional activator